MRRAITFTAGDKIHSKRCGHVQEFTGIIVGPRGNGYQVLNPKTGGTYQRERYDLIELEKDTAINR